MSEEKTESAAADRDDDDVDEVMKEVEEDPPKDLDDWPGGKAKYRTFGGAETDSGYGDGVTEKLGPADLQHHEDGSVTVEGEEVDNPDEYKSDPIPGGPTDPEAPKDPGFDEEAQAENASSEDSESDD